MSPFFSLKKQVTKIHLFKDTLQSLLNISVSYCFENKISFTCDEVLLKHVERNIFL